MKDTHQVISVGIIERIADGLYIPGERFGLAARPWEPSSAASTSRDMMGSEVLPVAGQRLPQRHDRWGDGHEWHDPQDCEDDVERRAIFGLAGGTIVGGLLSTAEPLRRRVDSALALPTNAYDADEWERTADQYAHLVGPTPAVVLPQLLADLDEAGLRTESADDDDTRSRMIRVCGLLSAMAAIYFVKLGHPMETNRYWRTAQRAAQVSGDRHLHALVRGERAWFTLYSGGRPQEILQLADDAIDIAGGAPSVGAINAHAARAQVFARQGSHSESVAALADVEAAFERLPECVLSDRESEWGWAEQRLRHVQSWVYSYSGRVAAAAEAQQAALAAYPPSFWRGPTQIQLHRALCIVISGDPSEGARHIMRTLEALPPNRRHDARHDGLVWHSASLVFDAIPAPARTLPDVRQARELFMLPGGVT
ncbi:MAG: hypothetical protein ACRDRH_14135, partial [Pseudonocardia sp.]